MKSHTRYQLIVLVLSICAIVLLPVTSARNQGGESGAGVSGLAPGGDDPTADLGVTKLGSPDEVNPGSNITYEITVTSGPDAADNATLSDPLPPTLTFVSLSVPAGWSCTTPSVGVGGTVSCTNPSLAATSGDVFSLVVNVPSDTTPGTFFTNTATVSTTTFDPNEENNSASAATLVTGNSTNMTVTKTAGAEQVVAGAALTYTIQVFNLGPDDAASVTLADVLPDSVTFYSLSQPAGWSCMTPAVGDGGTVSCSRPSLAVTGGETFTLLVLVRADTPMNAVITNTATVGTSSAESSTEDNSDTASTTVLAPDPTAADGRVTGRILDDRGNAISGAVVRLSGTNSRKTITDANGAYYFDNVDTGGFYTVTPSRANYNFNPFNRSFSQVGNQTEAVFTGISPGDSENPLDTPEYFVRQQYVDLLGREPEEAGFNFWTDQILACGDDVQCVNSRRREVAVSFFISDEYQASGSYVYDVYAGALGRQPVFSEYSTDRRQVVGGATLDAAKNAFAQSFVQRAEFVSKYQHAMTAETFIEALLQSARQSGGDLSSERVSLIGIYNEAADLVASRAAVIRALADNAAFKQSQYNQAFVLTEYFAYLRRDIDQGGYAFWLNVLTSFEGRNPAVYRRMVCSFTTSAEYQRRFSSIVSHNNGECGQ